MKQIMLLALAGVLLAGCGVKPGSVDAPPGQEDVKFPRTYPDMSADPVPNGPTP